ncbi:MAG: hypothetical protein QOF43_779 [Gaiellaceae bacterium]|jgi:predicted Zn-dependent protease|nr:hypothetical protein [Gaiellaceae bacterium]
MSARARVYAIVATAAALAVTGTVTIAWLQARGESTRQATAVTKPRPGLPPLTFTFGVRSDPEAVALAHAETLLSKHETAAALAVFDRYHSVQAQIGSAFAHWPGNGLETLKHIVATHPRSATAQLHLGWALLWAGRVNDAAKQFQRVDTQFPDAAESVIAEDVLYRKLAPNLPYIFTGLALPSAPTAALQLRMLERAARADVVAAKLRYGIALWSLRRRVSAERQFTAAARLAPHDPVAQTAAAIGTFTKRDPVRAFSRLGPLTAVFPKAAVVRLHLGVALIWTGQLQKAAKQLRLAIADEPGSRWARAARQLLSALPKDGTK